MAFYLAKKFLGKIMWKVPRPSVMWSCLLGMSSSSSSDEWRGSQFSYADLYLILLHQKQTRRVLPLLLNDPQRTTTDTQRREEEVLCCLGCRSFPSFLPRSPSSVVVASMWNWMRVFGTYNDVWRSRERAAATLPKPRSNHTAVTLSMSSSSSSSLFADKKRIASSSDPETRGDDEGSLMECWQSSLRDRAGMRCGW